jgi:hypothetical protein
MGLTYDLILNPFAVDGMLWQDQKELIVDADRLVYSISDQGSLYFLTH